MMIGIYAIVNRINDRVYIGQSINVRDRLAHHKSSQKHGRHENDYLQKSWNKYGEMHFDFIVLQECEETYLDELECYYIELFDSINRNKGYNLASGGNQNKHMSETSRLKMSKAKIGLYDGEKNPMYGVHLKHTDEWKQKMSARNSGSENPMYGIHLQISEAQKKKLSEAFSGVGNPFYGKEHTKETKERMRKNNKRKRPVVCVETSTVYESACEAGRQTGVFSDSINKCCNGKQHLAGGFHWKFVA